MGLGLGDKWEFFKLYRRREQVFSKLKSRKLWAAVAGAAIATLGSQLGLPDDTVSNIVQIVCVYIIGQGAVDVAGAVKAKKDAAAPKIIALLLLSSLWFSASPGMAQDYQLFEGDELDITERSVSEIAAQELANEPQDKRRKAQIEEAKGLLREKARIEKRLAELDNDAEPKREAVTISDGSTVGCLNWGSDTYLTPDNGTFLTPGGTNEIDFDATTGTLPSYDFR